MTDLTEMWQELARYQPYADKRGFGDAWRRMCEERTRAAAHAATDAAWTAKLAAEDGAATNAEAEAWLAAEFATNAEEAAAEVAEWKGRAIKNIRDAIAQEEP